MQQQPGTSYPVQLASNYHVCSLMFIKKRNKEVGRGLCLHELPLDEGAVHAKYVVGCKFGVLFPNPIWSAKVLQLLNDKESHTCRQGSPSVNHVFLFECDLCIASHPNKKTNSIHLFET